MSPKHKLTHQGVYLVILTVLISTIFVGIRLMVPSLFVMDDTVTYFIPNFIIQGETLFHGEIPFINFYQFLGQPLVGQGQTGVLYPGVYLAYLVARMVGNWNTVGITYAYTHVLIAGVGMFILLRKLEFGKKWALLGAMCYPFSGFNVMVGSNWIMTTAYFAWIPILLSLLIRREFWKLAIVNVAVFWIGYIQFFLIINFFLFLLEFWADRRNWNKLAKAYLLTFSLVLPVLLPMVSTFGNSVRAGGSPDPFNTYVGSWDVFRGWVLGWGNIHNRSNMIYPGVLVFHPLGLVTLLVIVGCGFKLRIWKLLRISICKRVWFWGSGLFLILLTAHMVFYVSLMRRMDVLDWLRLLWLCLAESVAVILLVYSHKRGGFILKLTSLGWLFSLLSIGIESSTSLLVVPYYYFFRWPFKFYLLVPVVLVTGNIVILAKIIRKFSLKKSWLIFLLVILWIWMGYFWSKKSLSFNTTTLAYTNFNPPEILRDKYHRSLGVGFGGNEQIGRGLVANYSSYWKILSWSGYDPVLSKNKSNLIEINDRDSISNNSYYEEKQEYLQVYGVKNYIVFNQLSHEIDFFNRSHFKSKYSDEQVTIYEDLGAKSVVQDDSGRSIEYRISGNKLVIMTSKFEVFPNKLLLGFKKDDDNWRAMTKEGEKLKVGSDKWGRLSVDVPGRTDEIRIGYWDEEFWKGAKLTLGLGVMGSGIWLARRRRKRRMN